MTPAAATRAAALANPVWTGKSSHFGISAAIVRSKTSTIDHGAVGTLIAPERAGG